MVEKMSSLEKYIKNSWYFINKLKPKNQEEIDKKQKWIDEVNQAQEILDMWNEHEKNCRGNNYEKK